MLVLSKYAQGGPVWFDESSPRSEVGRPVINFLKYKNSKLLVERNTPSLKGSLTLSKMSNSRKFLLNHQI